jgi:hypothetical protein
MNRVFILHATGAKLPSDLLGFTELIAERLQRWRSIANA